jgi:hypothetical protein
MIHVVDVELEAGSNPGASARCSEWPVDLENPSFAGASGVQA